MNRLLLVLTFSLAACNSAGLNGGPPPDYTVGPDNNPVGLAPRNEYSPSMGFVVHEWGTLTSVVASDGTLLTGLHHEEEDLPGFVADRMAQAQRTPEVIQKMETPVTYFYSPSPRQVSVSVGFPAGIFTQWYPYVNRMGPPVFYNTQGGNALAMDPWLDLNLSVPCEANFSTGFRDGLLDWGTIDVLAADDASPLPGPLGNSTWAFARNTKSNPVAVHHPDGTQDTERFLFYRGLGNFALPLRAWWEGPQVTFTSEKTPITFGGLFLMTVTADRAGFVELGDLPQGNMVNTTAPEATLDHASFVLQLKAALAARLVKDGLFADEAQAMVDTWERGYFLTPGTRLLYLLPESIINQVIPLSLNPAPDAVHRTMVIRLELLSPAYEATLSQWLTAMASPDPEQSAIGRAQFLALGRFAEPQLTRAIALSTNDEEIAQGNALLLQVRGQRRWAPTAAE
jgi:hypothetical protein